MEQTQVFWRTLLGGNHLVPLADDPNALYVDANCRFGEYAIELAYEFPHTPVIGIGTEPNSPIGRPLNCRFVVENVATGTTFGSNSCRFIHSRDMAMRLREEEWLPYLAELFRILEVGGCLQVLEISVWREYPGGVGGGYQVWCEKVFPALAQTKGVLVWGLERLSQLAAQVGFTEIYPIHYKIPVGDWGHTYWGMYRATRPIADLEPRTIEAGRHLRQNLRMIVESNRPLLLSIMMDEMDAGITFNSARGELYDENTRAFHNV
jgi:hypothetical protein